MVTGWNGQILANANSTQHFDNVPHFIISIEDTTIHNFLVGNKLNAVKWLDNFVNLIRYNV